MSLFKPSNFYPNLEEIDLEEDNTFSCQINSSGSSVKAYKIWFLSENNITILTSNAIKLDKFVKNKNFLEIKNLKNLEDYDKLKNGNNYKWGIRLYDAEIGSTKQPDTLICSGFLVGSTQNVIWTNNNDKLEYDRWIEFKTVGSSSMMPILEPNEENLKLPNSEEEFIERRKIDWVTKELGNNKNITKIETTEPFTYNYINDTKFTIYQCSDQHTYNSVFVDPNDMIELGMKIEILNKDSIVEPQRKIIGYSEDTGEIRVQEPFSNIPKNGYTYKLYKKDIESITYEEINPDVEKVIEGEHSLNSVTLKEAMDIQTGMYISLFKKEETNIGEGSGENTEDQKALKEVEVETKRKIISYDPEKKLVKVAISFSKTPIDGYIYKVYKENRKDLYEEVDFEVSNVIGGQPIEDDTFKVITNVYSDSKKILFIQPNINIKSDDTNPNEIVFNDGIRVDIQKIVDGNVDITFDKLDDSQWIITMPNSVTAFPVIPKTKYKIYSDFVDSVPENIFYAKKSPKIKISFLDLNIENSPKLEKIEDAAFYYLDFKPDPNKNYGAFQTREMRFVLEWKSEQKVQIKNYQFKLYDIYKNLIAQSDIVYDAGDYENIEENGIFVYKSKIFWDFKGLEAGKIVMSREAKEVRVPNTYYIEALIEDEYGKVFTINEVENYIQLEGEELNTTIEKVKETSLVSFNIDYKIKMNVSPLDVKLNCKENAIDINFTIPVDVPSSDFRYVNEEEEIILPTIKTEDVSKEDLKYNYLTIPIDKILHYSKLHPEIPNPDPANPKEFLKFPSKFSFITSFKLTKEFLESIPKSGENVLDSYRWGNMIEIMAFACKNPREDGEVTDKFSLRIGSFDNFYYYFNENKELKKIRINDNQFKFRLYRNGEVLPWFDGKDSFNWVNAERNSELIPKPAKENYYYALQEDNPKITFKENSEFLFLDSTLILLDERGKPILKVPKGLLGEEIEENEIEGTNIIIGNKLLYKDAYSETLDKGGNKELVEEYPRYKYMESSPFENLPINIEKASQKWITFYMYYDEDGIGNCSIRIKGGRD